MRTYFTWPAAMTGSACLRQTRVFVLLAFLLTLVAGSAVVAHDNDAKGTTAGDILVPETQLTIKIVDTSQNDPLQGGETPLVNAKVSATVVHGKETVLKQDAHAEEIAGAYGVHGKLDENGAHTLRWEITPPSGAGKTFSVEFPLQVAGAPQQHAAAPFLSGWRLIAVGAGGLLLLLGVFQLGRRTGGKKGPGPGSDPAQVATRLTIILVGASLATAGIAPVVAHPGHDEAAPASAARVADIQVGIGDTKTTKQTKTVEKYSVTLTVKVLRPPTPDPNRVQLTSAQAETIGIKMMTVSSGRFDTGLAVTGSVQADPSRSAKVASRVPGRLRSVAAGIGERVRSGQTLALVESAEIAEAQGTYSAAQSDVLARQAAYQQAQERVRIASRQLAQQRELASAGAFSQGPVQQALTVQAEAGSALATARADVAGAESQLAQARADLATHTKALQRIQELFDAGIRSRAELEAQQLEVTLDNARVTQAEVLVTQQQERVRQAEVRVSVATQSLRREQRIRGTNVLTRREIVQAQGAVDTARLEANQALADLNGAKRAVQSANARLSAVGAVPGSGNQVTVTAPFDGIVTEREAAIGETVSPDKALFTVLNPSVVVVEGDVFESDLPRVRVGLPARITTDSVPGKTFAGRISYLGATVNPETRATRARVAISNPGGTLRPGIFVHALLVTNYKQQTLTVPDEAVQQDGPLRVVYVKKGDVFERRTVTVGASAGGRTEIKTGIKPGEQIVTTGAYQLTAVSQATK